MTNRDAKALPLFEHIVAAAPADRERMLQEACATDDALRERVQRMLRADAREHPLLDRPPTQPTALTDSRPRGGWEGRQIGPYRLLRELGRGGMGVVYLAERPDVGARVAIKLVAASRSSAEHMVRFDSERRVLAQLGHPHIARFLDAGVSDDGTAWLVMEYVEGAPVDAHSDARSLTVDERVALLERVADAVAYAHRNLLVHRDIKPSNVLVSDAGAPKLVDFGIARLMAGSASDSPNEDEPCSPMTPEYATPEQLRCEPTTTAGDVYQLGLVLHELLTGRRLTGQDGTPLHFHKRAAGVAMIRPSTLVTREVLPEQLPGSSSVRTAAQLSALRRATPTQLSRRLNGDLDAILEKALRPQPAERYASALELAEDFRRYRQGRPVRARPPTYSYRLGKLIRRHRVAAAMAAGLVAVVIGSATLLLRQAQRIARERDRAEQVAQALQRLVTLGDPQRPRSDSTVGFAVLRDLAEQGRAGLASDPETWARILIPVADVYREMDRPDTTMLLLREVVHALQPRVDEAHPMLLMATSLLGEMLVNRGDFAGGLPLLDQVLDKARTLPAERRGEIAENVYNVAFGRQVAGHDADARVLYDDVLNLLFSLPDSGGALYDRTLVNLGALNRREGDLAASETLLRQAVQRRLARDGPGHDLTVNALASLARTLIARGNVPLAQQLADSVLAARRRLFTPPHSTLADALDLQASALVAAGRAADGEAIAREALAMTREIHGNEHFVVAYVQSHLVDALAAQGRTDEAQALQRDVVARYRRSAGEKHPGTLDATIRLAGLEAESGFADRAETLYREALPDLESFRAGSPGLFRPLAAFGMLLADTGRCDEAIPYLQRGLEHVDSSWAPDDERVKRPRLLLDRCRARPPATLNAR